MLTQLINRLALGHLRQLLKGLALVNSLSERHAQSRPTYKKEGREPRDILVYEIGLRNRHLVYPPRSIRRASTAGGGSGMSTGCGLPRAASRHSTAR